MKRDWMHYACEAQITKYENLLVNEGFEDRRILQPKSLLQRGCKKSKIPSETELYYYYMRKYKKSRPWTLTY